MSQAERYKHLPLAKTTGSIRLLRVLPTLKAGFIQCDIQHANLNQIYTALSYTWGPATFNTDILVSGKPYQVRRNLWDFLDLVRHNYPQRAFWIDAVCIDQTNIEERNAQVQMMSKVYDFAQNTIIWLGEFDRRSYAYRKSFFFNPYATPKIHNFNGPVRDCLAHFRQTYTGAGSLRKRVANRYPTFQKFGVVAWVLYFLLDHPYWNRLWIIQEIKRSRKHKYLLCGIFIVAWEPLADLLDYIIGEKSINPSEQVTDRVDPRKFQDASDQVVEQYLGQHDLQSGYVFTRPWYKSLSATVSSLSGHLRLCEYAHETLQRFRSELVYELICRPKQSTMSRQDFECSGFQLRPNLTYDIPFFYGYGDSKCSDRRDKIYGLTSLAGADVHFPVDYSLDVYDLYFRACRIFQEDEMKSNTTTALPLPVIASMMLRQLDLGLLDLVFGDPSGRTGVAEFLLMEQLRSNDAKASQLFVDKNLLSVDLSQDPHGLCECICPRCGQVLEFLGRDLSSNLFFRPTPVFCVVQCHDDSALPCPQQSQTRQHVIIIPKDENANDLKGHTTAHALAKGEPQDYKSMEASEQQSSSLSWAMFETLAPLHDLFPIRRQGLQVRGATAGGLQFPSLTEVVNILSKDRRAIKINDQMMDSFALEETAKVELLAWLRQEGIE